MSNVTKTLHVGYVLRKFPVLSETFILNEILALQEQGVTLHIFALAKPRDSRFHEGVARLKAPIYYLPAMTELGTLLRYNRQAARRFGRSYYRTLGYAARAANPTFILRFLQAGYISIKARRLRIDHLHAHFANRAANAAYLASRISSIPYSFTAHAFDIYQHGVDRKALQTKLNTARHVITVSEYNRSHLCRSLNGTSVNITRVYNGIDLANFTPARNSSGDTFTVLAVARLIEKKGLHILIEACHYLKEMDLEFRCWIIGKGAERRTLMNLIDLWELGECVQILAPHTQAEIVDRYHAANVFVLPCITAKDGNRDGLPVSIVEALACGVPVVTTPMTGIPEIVQDGHNGLLVPENDPRALAGAIDRLIREPDLRERLSARARDSVVSKFDIKVTSRQLREIFAQDMA